jgi:endonuclease/exonuclease/phosphatase family metal-dependent hydrolase
MSCIILRGRWCDIVLNVHAPTDNRIDGIKDRFYEELEQVFDKFRKHPMKILLGDFNAKVQNAKYSNVTKEQQISSTALYT